MSTLESHYRDLCDIEFTVERGKLWMLQTRVGKRTAAAAFTIACTAGRRGHHRHGRGAAPGERGTPGPARCSPPSTSGSNPAARRRGVGASPGAAVGRPSSLRRRRRSTERRDPGTPGDQPGRPARNDCGARDSHQPGRQDLTRGRGRPGMGKTCVCGADSIVVGDDRSRSTGRPSRKVISSPSTARRARSTSARFRAASPVVQYFDGRAAAQADPLVTAVDRLVRTLTKRRLPRCAPTPTPARTPTGPAGSGRRASG